MPIPLAQIEELENAAMNARRAGIISRYWARQGVVIEVSSDQGAPVRSNLQGNGLPPGYRGEDAVPVSPEAHLHEKGSSW
jgi:hypothetical protein